MNKRIHLVLTYFPRLVDVSRHDPHLTLSWLVLWNNYREKIQSCMSTIYNYLHVLLDALCNKVGGATITTAPYRLQLAMSRSLLHYGIKWVGQ